MVMNIMERTKQNEGERGVQLYLEHKCTEKVLLEQSGRSKLFGYLEEEI